MAFWASVDNVVSHHLRYPTRKMVEAELGGVEAMFTVFGLHYCRMFADPRMNVLFDTRHADTNVSALEHGKRVASALMDRWFVRRHASMFTLLPCTFAGLRLGGIMDFGEHW